MQAIRLQPALQTALQQFQQDPFTVSRLTQAYQEQSRNSRSSLKAARQFVYRNIQRLLRAGLLEKLPAPKGWPRYRLVDAFSASLPTHVQSNAGPVASVPKISPPSRWMDINVLQKRLSQHKSEMLCAMGEAEEYSALCQDHPYLQEQAQILYNQARDRSALLLGKVKALETLIAQHAQP